MLFTPYNEFLFVTDNFGATISDTGIGTSTPGPAGANAKNTVASVISGAQVIHDCHFLWLGFTGNATAATSTRFLVDIYFAPNGGTNWEASPRVANLYLHQPSLHGGIIQYAF